MIINEKSSEVDVYNLASFIEPQKRMLTDGTLIEFEEKETYEKTRVVRNIAYRYSKYEKSGILDGNKFSHKGYKLFQLIKIDQSWKISLIWENNKN